jgi:PIN domain nuclease of toxin-antitoxin system
LNLLFDTHAFLWWHGERSRVPKQILELCEQRENAVFLSYASIWEIQIKHHLGKLELKRPLATILEIEQSENDIQLLPITLPHLLSLYNLPHHHRDPFDRLLIAQTQVEGLILISHDSVMSQYPVQVLW